MTVSGTFQRGGMGVLYLAGVTALVAGAAWMPGGLLGMCALLVFGSCLTFALRKEKSLQLIALCAFTARALAAVTHSYIATLPDSQLDARTFELLAHEWALGGWDVVASKFRIGAFTYSWILSIPYLALGRSQLMVQSINVLLGTLVVVGVYRLAFHHFEHRIALRLAWVAALFPSLVLYSAITMREVFVTYPLVLGLIQFSTWLSSRSPKHFILGTLFFLLAGTFHYAILMCYITFVGLFFVINFVKTMKYGNGVQIVIQTSAALVGAPVMIWLVLNYQTDFGRLADVIGDLPKLLQLIDKTMSSRVAGRLAYLQGAEIKTFGDLLTLMPLRVAYFLFSPFPWELQAAADAFLSLDGMLYAVLVGASIRSLVKRHASRSTWPIFAAIVTMAAIFSFGTSNSGTAFRHRAKIAPLLIAVSASLVRPHRSSARSRDVHAAAAIDSGV